MRRENVQTAPEAREARAIQAVTAEVCAPHFYDPENKRQEL